MTGDLDPLQPARAVEMYLDARRDELADETLQSHKYRLSAFATWCDREGIESLSEVTGRDLYEYRIWRRAGHYRHEDDPEELAPPTLRSNLATLRAFLKFAATVDAVPDGLSDDVPLPNLSKGADVSDSTLDPERVPDVLDYLARYHYASRRHTAFLLAWHTGCRLSGLHSLDLRDLDFDGDPPMIEFVHRPETGTTLKNSEGGERMNVVSRHVATVVEDWIDGPRPEGTDDHGRRPLFSTRHGRVHKGTLRTDFYAVTRPCWYGKPCPHDRDPETCDAADLAEAYGCPSSRSPHDVRSGRVTAYRLDDTPRDVVSERLDASGDVLDKHYDRRNARQRAKQREKWL